MNPVYYYIVFGALIAWSMYRRIRRSIGRQKLRTGRIIFRLVVFCLAASLLILLGLIIPHVLAGLGAGILGGAILGFVSLKLTKFETTEEGHFYTPDTRIGMAISLFFVGRLIYRMPVMMHPDMAASAGHPPAGQSPLTYVISGLMFGYYIVYYIGLFVHTHDKTPATPASAIPPVLAPAPSPAPPMLGGEASANK